MSEQQKSLVPSPMGCRVAVKDINTSLSIEERAKRSGLVAVVNDRSRPRNTLGRIVALGTDPFLQENGLEVGQVVCFGALSGTGVVLQGVQYRIIGFSDIISTIPPEAVPEEVPWEAPVE